MYTFIYMKRTLNFDCYIRNKYKLLCIFMRWKDEYITFKKPWNIHTLKITLLNQPENFILSGICEIWKH